VPSGGLNEPGVTRVGSGVVQKWDRGAWDDMKVWGPLGVWCIKCLQVGGRVILLRLLSCLVPVLCICHWCLLSDVLCNFVYEIWGFWSTVPGHAHPA
jgi:hypothetical protein